MALYGLRYLLPSTSRIADVIVLAAGTAVWLIVAGGCLYLTGSNIPRQLRARVGLHSNPGILLFGLIYCT
jgi:hypothetical protein